MSNKYWASDSKHSGPALLDALYESKFIDYRVFAIHFDDFGGSTQEFGGYNSEKMTRYHDLI